MKKLYYYLYFICIPLAINSFVNAEYIFVSNENSDTIAVLDLNTKELIKTIKTGGRPRDLKFNKDFSRLYAVVSEENHILEIDTKKIEIVELLIPGMILKFLILMLKIKLLLYQMKTTTN